VYGNDAQRRGWVADAPARFLRLLWRRHLGGQITAQPLVIRNVPAAGQSTIVVGSSNGELYALDERGRERWHVSFGQAETTCDQLAGFGITGTPVVDARRRTLYVADSFGLLHARDLGSGLEVAGWPVRLFDDYERELVWGAMALVGDSVYVPTGSICDRPMEGKVIRVATTTRAMTAWKSVPFTRGGGGGIWGWGGVTYSATRDSLLVVTGNAFRGGANQGKQFSEAAGYGERLVKLTRDLGVSAANHPGDLRRGDEQDFTGSPLVVTPRGCKELVIAANKHGRVYGWRSGSIGRGPRWSVRAPGVGKRSHVSQLAYAPATGSILVSTYSRLSRYDLAGHCSPHLAWSRRIGDNLLNGSPTVAGRLVWLARAREGHRPALLGIDLRSGSTRLRAPLPDPSFVAPTVIDGRLYTVSIRGDLSAFALR
jgi:outer membrane protein assembly factor BamB